MPGILDLQGQPETLHAALQSSPVSLDALHQRREFAGVARIFAWWFIDVLERKGLVRHGNS